MVVSRGAAAHVCMCTPSGVHAGLTLEFFQFGATGFPEPLPLLLLRTRQTLSLRDRSERSHPQARAADWHVRSPRADWTRSYIQYEAQKKAACSRGALPRVSGRQLQIAGWHGCCFKTKNIISASTDGSSQEISTSDATMQLVTDMHGHQVRMQNIHLWHRVLRVHALRHRRSLLAVSADCE